MHSGLLASPPRSSGMTTTGARPWWWSAQVSSRWASWPPSIQSRGLPGWPPSITSNRQRRAVGAEVGRGQVDPGGPGREAEAVAGW